MSNNAKLLIFILVIGLLMSDAKFRNDFLHLSKSLPTKLSEQSKKLNNQTEFPTNTSDAPSALPTTTTGTMAGYSREKFRHWSDLDGNGCNSREDTLRRDGKNLTPSSGCDITSGRWVDPYSGDVFSNPTELDIDHLVPLAAAWREGANSWTAKKREEFANDPINLLAVSAHLNRQKGDKLADAWKPPLKSYWCVYAQKTIKVHVKYQLPATVSEKNALETMVGTC